MPFAIPANVFDEWTPREVAPVVKNPLMPIQPHELLSRGRRFAEPLKPRALPSYHDYDERAHYYDPCAAQLSVDYHFETTIPVSEAPMFEDTRALDWHGEEFEDEADPYPAGRPRWYMYPAPSKKCRAAERRRLTRRSPASWETPLC